MRLYLFLPGLSLWHNRRKNLGIIFLLLQPTVIGWVVGVYVARRNLKRQRRRRRLDATSSDWQSM